MSDISGSPTYQLWIISVLVAHVLVTAFLFAILFFSITQIENSRLSLFLIHLHHLSSVCSANIILYRINIVNTLLFV
nr:MAG TPA: hypothetical protein [Caudoviricetes sp.]